ncbi:hypothetical protein ACI5KX_04980 [Erythrobacter sp. GH1-10]|uniref:hypothetical protein n=1 Tax=Erythrobacter sp. GH1-10 TaxID=3349334 RepID=UPI0038782EED
MSPEDQKAIAKATAQVAGYLAQPEGMDGRAVGGVVPEGMATSPAAPAEGMFFSRNDNVPQEASWADRRAAVDAIGEGEFRADAAREGAAVAGELLREVKFPAFVSGLIEGVFSSITQSSIEQMEAYQNMIANVAKSLSQYMDDHVTENQGRDNLVDQFPDLFEIGSGDAGGFGDFGDFGDGGDDVFGQTQSSGPRLKLRDGVGESEALRKVNNKLTFEEGNLKSLDLSDENVERALVENSRMQLARQRQQLMASIVLMGINRIVVTDGRISAKVKYDVRTSDRLSKRRSAAAMDYARNRWGGVEKTRDSEREWDSGGSREGEYNTEEYSADWFSKGNYKYEEKPIITASTMAAESQDAAMMAKIELQGAVDVNFKSDYLPLNQMATPGMIAAIQGNARPVDPNVVPSPRGAPPPPTTGNTGGNQSTGGTIAPPPA